MKNLFGDDATIGANLDDLLDVFGVAKSVGNELKTFGEVFQYIMDAKGMVENAKQKVSQSKLDNNIVPTDSVCNTCNNKPHGLPYTRYDSKGEPIDIIDPQNKIKK